MSENPSEAPHADPSPPDRQRQKPELSCQTADGGEHAQFSLLTLLCLTFCAAINVAAFTQSSIAMPYAALFCNTILFAGLVKDASESPAANTLKAIAQAVLIVLVLLAYMPLLMIFIASHQ